MRLASINNQPCEAFPCGRGVCPSCRDEVIAKCGRVNAWHWAHRTADCDSWSEPLTHWHVDWQSLFPMQWCEIPVGNHRADVRLPDGRVLEFQHSNIAVEDIRAREDHYGNMIWIFDAIEAYDEDRLNLRRKDEGGNFRSFRWKHPRRSILSCRRPVVLDTGFGGLLHLKKMYPKAPYGGWGYAQTVDEFLLHLNVFQDKVIS